MWIVNVAGCYLGDRDKLVDAPEDAHKFRYKKAALNHAVTWSVFHSWMDGSPVKTVVQKAPIHKKA